MDPGLACRLSKSIGISVIFLIRCVALMCMVAMDPVALSKGCHGSYGHGSCHPGWVSTFLIGHAFCVSFVYLWLYFSMNLVAYNVHLYIIMTNISYEIISIDQLM